MQPETRSVTADPSFVRISRDSVKEWVDRLQAIRCKYGLIPRKPTPEPFHLPHRPPPLVIENFDNTNSANQPLSSIGVDQLLALVTDMFRALEARTLETAASNGGLSKRGSEHSTRAGSDAGAVPFGCDSIASSVTRPVAPVTDVMFVEDDGCDPAKINDYIILKQVGRGATAKVYQVYNDVDDSFYAMKSVRNVRQVFGRGNYSPAAEIAILKKFNHRNVCRLYEAINDPMSSRMYLVMPLYEKGPLDINAETGECACRITSHLELRRFLLQVLRGLRYLHSHDVAHWDLKPENILCGTTSSGDNEAKLIDFGVSQELSDPSSTNASRQRGTIAFWAPEMFSSNDSGEIDGKAADVWALGVIMFAALCGRLPFYANSVSQLSEQVTRGVLEFPENIEDDVQSVLEYILVPDPARRPTVEDIRQHPFFEAAASRPVAGEETLDLSSTHWKHERMFDVPVTPKTPLSGFRRFASAYAPTEDEERTAITTAEQFYVKFSRNESVRLHTTKLKTLLSVGSG